MQNATKQALREYFDTVLILSGVAGVGCGVFVNWGVGWMSLALGSGFGALGVFRQVVGGKRT